jgi:hypothetical protein
MTLKRVMDKELKQIRRKAALQEDFGWRIIEPDGKTRKARPEELPKQFMEEES